MGKKQGSQLWAYYVKYVEKQLEGLTQNISNWLPLGGRIIAFFFFVLITLLTLYLKKFFFSLSIYYNRKKKVSSPTTQKNPGCNMYESSKSSLNLISMHRDG